MNIDNKKRLYLVCGTMDDFAKFIMPRNLSDVVWVRAPRVLRSPAAIEGQILFLDSGMKRSDITEIEKIAAENRMKNVML